MFRVVGADRNPQGIHQVVTVQCPPPDLRVQVYVFSWRSGLHYPQENPYLDCGVMKCRVVLGDMLHSSGMYTVYAVGLSGEPAWGPQVFPVSGMVSDEFVFKRRGI